MDSSCSTQGSARAGTLGGTLTVLLTLNSQAMLETVVLAALGALVSFSVSIALKRLLRWWHDR